MALSSKLQACCINFNDAIKKHFGSQYSLERRLPIALQFAGFDGPQRKELIGKDLPGNIQTAMDDFDRRLTATRETSQSPKPTNPDDETVSMDHRILRFRWLDRAFYPYLNQILDRLPDEVRERILADDTLQIIGDETLITTHGRCYQFDPNIRHLIFLNPVVLRMPEPAIIETIAHEFVHYVAGKGDIGLYEKEAGDLLKEWRFTPGAGQCGPP